jgi:hypothetical protein
MYPQIAQIFADWIVLNLRKSAQSADNFLSFRVCPPRSPRLGVNPEFFADSESVRRPRLGGRDCKLAIANLKLGDGS